MTKSRRRWLIALVLAFGGAFVFAWLLASRPPYAFLAESTLYFVEVDKGASILYQSKSSPNEVLGLAKLEIAGHWNPGYTGASLAWVARTKNGSIVIYEVGSEIKKLLIGRYPEPKEGTRTMISINRPATLLDRAQSWLFGLRYKGSAP